MSNFCFIICALFFTISVTSLFLAVKFKYKKGYVYYIIFAALILLFPKIINIIQ